MSRSIACCGVLVGVLVVLPASSQKTALAADGPTGPAAVTPPEEQPAAPSVTFGGQKGLAGGSEAGVELTDAERLRAMEQRLQGIEARIGQLMDYLGVPAKPEAPTAAANGSSAALTRLEEKVDRLLSELGAVKTQVVARPIPAAQNTAPTQGTLVLRNWTSVPQLVSINGQRFYVDPGRTERAVPLDSVEMYLPNTEIPRRYERDFFRWNGEVYTFQIDIRQ